MAIDWKTFNVAACTRCKLCETRTQVVLPKIVKDCLVMFVGEGPGSSEDECGEPFVGESGQLLSQYMLEAGINRNECSVINAVNCKPPRNRPPETEELKACSDILDHYIAEANPKIIVPLGNVALKRITGRSGITKYNGLILETEKYPGRKIIPVVHPAFALRDPKNITALKYGLSRVKDAIDNKVLFTLSKVTYVDTIDKFNTMMGDLTSKPYFSIDIETSTLHDWKTGHIICISFSTTPGSSYVLPWVVGDKKYYDACRKHAPTENRNAVIELVSDFCFCYKLNLPSFFWGNNPEVKEQLVALFADETKAKILHNYAFDYKYLSNAGLVIKGTIFDTMILHYLLDETKRTHGLKDLAIKHTSYGQYDNNLKNWVLEQEKKCDTYAIVPMEELTPYAGTDADVTILLFEKFWPMIEALSMQHLYLGFLMPVTRMLMTAEVNGIMVDEVWRNQAETVLESALKEIEKKLLTYSSEVTYSLKNKDVTGVNFKSPKQLSNFLFQHLRLPIISKTAKGDPCTDEEVLTKLSKLHEVPALLLTYRKLAKQYSTYVMGIKDMVWPDGKVHPNFFIHGTETGRLSSSNPNCQNLTRNPQPGEPLYKLNLRIRDIFMASNPDTHCLVEVDYSQAELRLIAEYSRDPVLYSAFLEGRDPHAELAVRMYHKDKIADMEAGNIRAENIVTKEERQRGKTANFSLAYGKHPENFAKEEGIPYEEAVFIYNSYWSIYRGIEAWKRVELEKAYKNLYFQSFFGRRRRLPKLLSHDNYMRAEAEREGINFLIQSQASDYTLMSALKVSSAATKEGIDYKILSFVHDSIVFEVRKTQIQEFLNLLKTIMTKVTGMTLPMEIEVKLGRNLGSLKEWVIKNNLWTEKTKKTVDNLQPV